MRRTTRAGRGDNMGIQAGLNAHNTTLGGTDVNGWKGSQHHTGAPPNPYTFCRATFVQTVALFVVYSTQAGDPGDWTHSVTNHGAYRDTSARRLRLHTAGVSRAELPRIRATR